MFSKTLGNVEIDKLDQELLYAQCLQVKKDTEFTCEAPMMFKEIYSSLMEKRAIGITVREHIDLQRITAYMSPELNKYMINVTEALVNQKCLYKYILLHELGHIFFNHSSLPLYYELKRVIAKCLESKQLGIDIVMYYFHKFANIAADFEINSKLFSPTEFSNLCKLLNLSASHNITIGCHPDFLDFPRQLTATEYIALLLKDIKEKDKPQEIIEKMSQILQKVQEKEKNSSSMNINNRVASPSRNEMDKKSVVKIKKEEVDNFFEGGGNAKSKLSEETLNIDSDKDIANLVNQLFSKEYLSELHKHNLYNYNRGKVNYILPRYKNSLKSTITDIFFVIDVSPSMDLHFVKKFIKEIKNKLSALNYRLICFANDITFNGRLSRIKDKFPTSLGTNIAIPMNKLLAMGVNKDTKVILVSDFEVPNNVYIEYLNQIPNIMCIETMRNEVSYYPSDRIRKDIQHIQIKINS